jgi:hypothetical protein
MEFSNDIKPGSVVMDPEIFIQDEDPIPNLHPFNLLESIFASEKLQNKCQF